MAAVLQMCGQHRGLLRGAERGAGVCGRWLVELEMLLLQIEESIESEGAGGSSLMLGCRSH